MSRVKYGRRKDDVVCTVCKTLCKLCHGGGLVSRVTEGERFDRGDGVIYGSGTWSSEHCPHGCPWPRAYYSAGTYSARPITDARARSTRMHDL